jgi:hypothetical protein
MRCVAMQQAVAGLTALTFLDLSDNAVDADPGMLARLTALRTWTSLLIQRSDVPACRMNVLSGLPANAAAAVSIWGRRGVRSR